MTPAGNISWSELQRTRTPAPSIFNSAHYLECMEVVRRVFPDASIRQVSENLWMLFDGTDALSGPYNSHYACWAEARQTIEGGPRGTGK